VSYLFLMKNQKTHQSVKKKRKEKSKEKEKKRKEREKVWGNTCHKEEFGKEGWKREGCERCNERESMDYSRDPPRHSEAQVFLPTHLWLSTMQWKSENKTFFYQIIKESEKEWAKKNEWAKKKIKLRDALDSDCLGEEKYYQCQTQ